MKFKRYFSFLITASLTLPSLLSANPELDQKSPPPSQLEKKDANAIPLDIPLEFTNKEEKTTLADLLKDKKAIYIDFWATWCGPCIKSIPELITRASTWSKQGVVVIGINVDSKPKAEKIRKDKNIDFPWLIEPKDEPYSTLFKIDSIPRAIIISSDGKLLFNGHPSSDELLKVVKSLGIKTE